MYEVIEICPGRYTDPDTGGPDMWTHRSVGGPFESAADALACEGELTRTAEAGGWSPTYVIVAVVDGKWRHLWDVAP